MSKNEIIIKKKVKPKDLCKLLGIKYKWYNYIHALYIGFYNHDSIIISVGNKSYTISDNKTLNFILKHYKADYFSSNPLDLGLFVCKIETFK